MTLWKHCVPCCVNLYLRLVSFEASDCFHGWQEAGEEHDAGDSRTRLWAHPIKMPEKGCLLISHPLMFTTQQMYFSQVYSIYSATFIPS